MRSRQLLAAVYLLWGIVNAYAACVPDWPYNQLVDIVDSILFMKKGPDVLRQLVGKQQQNDETQGGPD